MNGYEAQVARSAGIASAIVTLPALAGATLWRGWPGWWGALIGATVVVIFLLIHLLVAAVTRSMDPISTMAMAMFAYFAKILALAGFLIAFRNATWLDRYSFGATAICVTAAWLAAEIRAFVKARFVLGEGFTPEGGRKERADG